MNRLAFSFFCLWVLLLPFSNLTKMYFGNFALDKLLAPALFAFWVVEYLLGGYRFPARKRNILIVAVLVFFCRDISFARDSNLFVELLLEDAVFFVYFALPVLFIDSRARANIAAKLIVANAILGCVSVFLVSRGLLVLPFERFEASRIGILALPKSIGLFRSYGDLAQHTAVLMLAALYLPILPTRHERLKKWVFAAATVIFLLGLIGAQSRSYLLSVIGGLLISRIMLAESRKAGMSLTTIAVATSIAIGLALLPFVFSGIVDTLTGLGGEGAAGTAGGRLVQYQSAFRALDRYSYLTGVGAAFYAADPDAVDQIHNMWLGLTVRGGLLAVLPLLIVVVMVVKRAFFLLRFESTRSLGLLVTGYMAAFFIATQFYPGNTIAFWLLFGVMTGITFSIETRKARS